jgi:PAS domain S-box-containing protein/putative nucleotidyltransferase with HDIG domain
MKEQAGAKVKILVADDSPDNLSLFRRVLENKGFTVLPAHNGEEALEILRKGHVDLILSDILMPVMDGFHLLQECKDDPRLREIPFVFITGAFLDKKDEELAAKLGVSAFIRKPVEPQELARITEESLTQAKSKRRGRKPKIEKATAEKQFSINLMEKLRERMQELELKAAEQVKAEKTLSIVENEYRLLLDTLTQGVVCADERGRITSVNPAAVRILGLAEARVVGSTPADAYWEAVREDGTELPADEFPISVALKTGKPVNNVIMGIYNPEDEEYHWISGSAVPQFRPGEERPFQVCAIFEDITDRFLSFKALQENESRLNAIIENTSDVIVSIDRDYCLVSANAAAEKKYRLLTASRLVIGQNILDPMLPERRAFWDGTFRRVLNGERLTFENHYDTEEGAFEMEFSVNPVVSPSARVSGVSLFGRDITGRMKNERALHESEERYRLLVENAADAIFVIQDAQIKFAKSGVSGITGYTGAEMMAMPLSELIQPDDLPGMLDFHARRMRNEEAPDQYIYRAIHKSGSTRWVQVHVTTISWEGRPAALTIQTDITGHKQLEEGIEKANRLYKVLFLSSEAVVLALTEQQLLDEVCHILVETGGYRLAWVGYSEDDERKTVRPVAGCGAGNGYLSSTDITWAETDERGRGPTGMAVNQGITIVNQDVSQNPDFAPWLEEAGTIGYAGMIALPLKLYGGVIGALNIYASFVDAFAPDEIKLLEQLSADLVYGITSMRERQQRMESEEALRQSEQRFRKAVQSTTDIVWDWNIRTGQLDWYGDIEGMLGYEPAEIQRTRAAWEELIFPADRDRVAAALDRHAQTGEPYQAEYRVCHKDGAERIWIDRGLAVHDREGEIVRSVGACVDITEHRLAEQRTKIRRDLALALASSTDIDSALKHGLNSALQISGLDAGGIYLLEEKTGDFVLAHQNGYTADRVARFSVLKADSVNTRLINGGKSVFARVSEFEPPFDEQFESEDFTYSAVVPIMHGGKAIACLVASSCTITDTSKEVRRSIEHIASDIGIVIERIKSREALQASEARYRFITDNTIDVIWALDKNLRYAYVSPSITRQRGYSVEEAMQLDVTAMLTPSSLDAFSETIESTIAPGLAQAAGRPITYTQELELYCKDGSTMWSEMSFAVILDSGGVFNGLIGVSRDITDRRRLETELRESEEKYRLVVDNAREGIIVLQDGVIKFANRGFPEVLGYVGSDVISQPFLDFVYPDDREMIIDKYRRRLLGEKIEEAYNMRILDPTASILWVEVRGLVIEWEGRPATLNFITNITERKKAEDALRDSEEKYRTMIEGMDEGYYEIDSKGNYIFFNDAVVRQIGYSREELMGLNYKAYIPPDEIKRAVGIYSEVFRTGRPRHWVPTVNIRKDGTLVYLEDSIYPLRNEKGEIIGLRGLVRDVTERKKAEADLKNALDKITSTLEGSMDAIAMMSELRDPYTAGHQRNVTQLAISIATEMGLSEEQMSGLRVAGLLHDVGKVYVPSEILSKPGKLSELEKGLAKAHAEAGYDIVKTIRFPWPVDQIIRQHHERMDGSGYPRGLSGDDIMLEARILAVADVVEAMMSHRPYRPALGLEKALDEITGNRGTLYDEKAVDTCVSLFRVKGFQFTA